MRFNIHRLRLPAYVAGKICTVVILRSPTIESVCVKWGQLLVNLYINPKLIFMALSPSIYPISMALTWPNRTQACFWPAVKKGPIRLQHRPTRYFFDPIEQKIEKLAFSRKISRLGSGWLNPNPARDAKKLPNLSLALVVGSNPNQNFLDPRLTKSFTMGLRFKVT